MRSSLRSWLATLCLALSVVFAGTSAASVVDRVQHAANAPHVHAVDLTITLADADPPQHLNGGDHDDFDGPADDHPLSLGHHHADGPTGFVTRMDATLATLMIGDALTPIAATASVAETWPGGLERPPKANANYV